VPKDSPLANDVRRLYLMAEGELSSMREVVTGLRSGAGAQSNEALLTAAVKRQAARFGELFNIAVNVQIEGQLAVSRRMAGEILHLVAEALANVRRHTRARRVDIQLEGDASNLVLRVFNKRSRSEKVPKRFEPRSLSERSGQLGGRVTVMPDAMGTTVRITLPLRKAVATKAAPAAPAAPAARVVELRQAANG
jgi:two-component system nitrate/nitrite sensor histidine kinase NarX